MSDYLQSVEHDGFAIVERVVEHNVIDGLARAIDGLPESDAVRRKQNVYGIRNLLEVCPAVADLAVSPPVRALVTPVLGDHCFAVRATFFDKVPDANWKLRWHQDSVIAVKKRIDTPGFEAWAEKAGVQQVRPPESVLRHMLAIRVHLDDCRADNGPLRVLVGSHTGRWDRDDLETAKSRHTETVCEVSKGGVLAMRPLLLHASGPSQSPHHRRVVHLEYAAADLPNVLEWRSRVS